MGTRYRAAFFDFGGTLFSYRDVGGRTLGAVREAVERLGVTAPRSEIGRSYRRASQAAYARYAESPYYLHQDLFKEIFAGFARELGREVTPDFLDWMHERQRRAVLDNFVLRADCVPVLEALRAAGLHVAVVSNIDDDYLLPMLERCGLRDRLDAWTSSEEARSCKPDLAIFRHALQKAGCEPRESVFVGDSLEADVAGARAIGMIAVHLAEEEIEPPGQGVGAAGRPHHVIDRLTEVLAIAGIG